MADYPLPKFHFQVEWGGARIGFTEVSGLDVETEIIEYRDGSRPEYTTSKIPGMQKYGNITLKRGVFASDNEYYNWWNTVSLNTIERRDITVSLLNDAAQSLFPVDDRRRGSDVEHYLGAAVEWWFNSSSYGE